MLLWTALCIGALPATGAAQRFWNTSYAPYAYYSTVDGLWLAGYAKRYSPLGFREQPEPDRAWAQIRGGLSTAGSYVVEGEVRAPAWWEGWRLRVALAARRDNRLGYYGIGNETAFDRDSIAALGAYFYHTSRTTRSARLTIQRRLVGPVRLLLGGTLDRSDFRALPGGSVWRRDLASGTVDPATIPFTDAVLRTGLVVDTRDHEVDPHRGVFAEALYASGTGYTRTTGAARVWVQPVERLWLVARAAGEAMTGTPPLAAQMMMESSEAPFVAVGGYRSLRGYHDARFVGPGKLTGTVEVRYAVVWVPTIFELKVTGFYDAGRVFGPGERFRITSDGLHAGGGGALAARLLRNTVLVLGAGAGQDGWQLLFDTGWAF